MNLLIWIRISVVGIMLTNFYSPPVTKPTTCLTTQDNQSMEISQTTHKYTHTHRHCMVQKQIALLKVKLYFSTKSCETSKSSRLKYQSNGGEFGTFITLLHMDRHFARWHNGLTNNENILHQEPFSSGSHPQQPWLKGMPCVVAETLHLPL